jgi:hypothetical protein
MGITLDEYLAEVDRWKQPVSDLMLQLTPSQRAEQDRQARAWLQEKLGRHLQEAPGKAAARHTPARE